MPTATAPPVDDNSSFKYLQTTDEMDVDRDKAAVYCEENYMNAKINNMASENNTLKDDYEHVILENTKLYKELNRHGFSRDLEWINDKVHYFTGFPSC